jgi:SAM-dependent methyltransferase
MSEGSFDLYSCYYDLLYQDKDYQEETRYIIKLLEEFAITGGHLLEYGSGTGIHGKLLGEAGYHVLGIELSEKMVQRAETSDNFTLKQGDICELKLGRKFDAVLSLFHVASYLTDNERINSLFARASEHLESAGVFIFDVWYSPAVLAQKASVRVKRVSDGIVDITRIAEPDFFPNENRIDVNYTIFVNDRKTDKLEVVRERHPMRHFSLPEIALLAECHGFAIRRAEEFLSGQDPSTETWGVCFVLEKIR